MSNQTLVSYSYKVCGIIALAYFHALHFIFQRFLVCLVLKFLYWQSTDYLCNRPQIMGMKVLCRQLIALLTLMSCLSIIFTIGLCYQFLVKSIVLAKYWDVWLSMEPFQPTNQLEEIKSQYFKLHFMTIDAMLGFCFPCHLETSLGSPSYSIRSFHCTRFPKHPLKALKSFSCLSPDSHP